MITAANTWDRERLESLKGWDRPSVRCRVDVIATAEDGRTERRVVDKTARIHIDGNNPWVEVSYGSLRNHAERISWGLLLEILNDPFAGPYHFTASADIDI